MKIVITENKIFDTIYKYIDKYFNPNEIDWVYGENDEADWQENPENEHFLIFYEGYYLDEYESNVFFHYFDEDYYDSESSINSSPVLEVLGEYAKHLDTIFGNHWVEPMKKWFQDKFNLPVNTVSTYYDDNED
jgi:hypothetical protein